MLVIRREQMEILSSYMRERFEDRMVVLMRKRFARAASLRENDLKEQVREVIALVEGHGIDYESDVEQFLLLVFERWPDARNNAEIKRILDSNSLTGDVKVAFVADILTEEGH
jgi:hypothetical protein